MDAERALLLEYMSALSGNAEASLGMGYRLLLGVDVAASCERALPFLEIAANVAAEHVSNDVNGVFVDRTHLAQDHDASRWQSSAEITDYYAHLADSGDVVAATLLGTLYATGSRQLPIDERKAIFYLRKAVKAQSPSACGLLGYLLAKQRFKRLVVAGQPLSVADDESRELLDLLKLAAKKGDPNGVVGLGFVHMHGLGVPQNQSKALEFFHKGLAMHADAGFYKGELLMKAAAASSPLALGQSPMSWRNLDLTAAAHAYSTATQLGHVLAQHRLMHMTTRGMGVPRSCEAAANGFLAVAKRGRWSQLLAQAHQHFQQNRYSQALNAFSRLAAVGYEAAQANAAFLLDKMACASLRPATLSGADASSVAVLSAAQWAFRFDDQAATASRMECDVRRLALLGLSASLGNGESLLQIGDFYYYGKAQLAQGRVLAASFYQRAADLKHTQALFNLGLMHEVGDGVKQDFHLAKRRYDLAAEIDVKARLPRDIALLMLEAHKWLITTLGADVFSPRQPLPPHLLGVQSALFSALNFVGKADEEIRGFLDDISAQLSHALRAAQSRLLSALPPALRIELLHYFYHMQNLLQIFAPRDGGAVKPEGQTAAPWTFSWPRDLQELKTLVDRDFQPLLTSLIVLLCVLAAFRQLWRRHRRQLRERRR